jgi:hypothetical protein
MIPLFAAKVGFKVNPKRRFSMIKKSLLLVSVFLAGSAGWVWAQNAMPVSAGDQPLHMRIFELKGRIKAQRDRIAEGLKDNTITKSRAEDCLNVLDGVENDIKAESAANGPNRFMRREKYDSYNQRLDMNSAFVREHRQYYYYYGNYYDQHPNEN